LSQRLSTSSWIEPELERGRKWRKSEAREGVYKSKGVAVVRKSSAFSLKKPAHPHPYIYRY
jgi:hypothetical protein